MIMRLFDGLQSFSTGRIQADNCNDFLGAFPIVAVYPLQGARVSLIWTQDGEARKGSDASV
jgi:hypothetical protein